MKIPCALAFAMILAASPVAAQDAPPSSEAPNRPFRLEASVAPKWAYGEPFVDDVESDTTAASLKLIYSPKIARLPVELAFTAGPSFTLDNDDDSLKDGDAQSDFALSATAALPLNKVEIPLIQRISLFGSLGRTWEFADFLAGDREAKNTFEGGLKIGREFRSRADTKLGGSIALGATNHSDDASDHHYTQGKLTFATPVSRFADFDIEASWTQRRNENVDSEHGVRERREDLGVSVGFDLARWARSFVGDSSTQPWIRKIKVGYVLTEKDSNIEGNDKDESSPSVTFTLAHYFKAWLRSSESERYEAEKRARGEAVLAEHQAILDRIEAEKNNPPPRLAPRIRSL